MRLLILIIHLFVLLGPMSSRAEDLSQIALKIKELRSVIVSLEAHVRVLESHILEVKNHLLKQNPNASHSSAKELDDSEEHKIEEKPTKKNTLATKIQSNSIVLSALKKPTFQKQWLTNKQNSQTSVVSERNLEEPSEEEESYAHALSMFRTDKKKEALAQLLSFVTAFPESKSLGEVHYMIGDIYLSKSDYKKASLNFLKSYRAQRDGRNTPLAMVKLVKSLRMLKELEHACIILKRTLSEFGEVKQIKTELLNEKKILEHHCYQ